MYLTLSTLLIQTVYWKNDDGTSHGGPAGRGGGGPIWKRQGILVGNFDCNPWRRPNRACFKSFLNPKYTKHTKNITSFLFISSRATLRWPGGSVARNILNETTSISVCFIWPSILRDRIVKLAIKFPRLVSLGKRKVRWECVWPVFCQWLVRLQSGAQNFSRLQSLVNRSLHGGRAVFSASISISRSLYFALWDAVFRQTNMSYNDCCAVSKLSWVG